MTQSGAGDSKAIQRARYIMVGGFLGAGKTSALARLARHLTEHGQRVGLITNDQGQELVDTAFLQSQGFNVQEIGGGCFCCRFNSLLDAAEKLSQGERPDVFLAEPVGSCTDLLATVSYPLRRIYGDRFEIAPLSVLVDPRRAARLLELEEGPKFSLKVSYIYRKQLEEAELIVINKRELLSVAQLDKLQSKLAAEFPQAAILAVSARTGENLESWFAHLETSGGQDRTAMPLNYDWYAEGEAMLGWLNASIRVKAMEDFEADGWLKQLAGDFQKRLARAGFEVAHLKMTFDPEGPLGEVAVVNLVGNEWVPELSQSLADPIREGSLTLNLRAEAPPGDLREMVSEVLAGQNHEPQFCLAVEHLESFQPGRPTPTHPVMRTAEGETLSG